MDCEFKFHFKSYQKHFKQPLQTSHGTWRIREGIIVSLTDLAGNISQGEIAPLPWFGSETLAEAREFCQQLEKSVTESEIMAISDSLPCCQFALESAYLGFKHNATLTSNSADSLHNIDFCYLLPAGEKALNAWQDSFYHHQATTFKWKIGVLPLATEIKLLQRLIADLPDSVKLRLDANGGLNLEQARQLLAITDSLKAIEFVEQPLAPEKLDEILQLEREYQTLIALDESVASFKQLQQVHHQNWQGVYVIKAAIIGYSQRLVEFCQDNDLDIVFSSVFETQIGRQKILNLSQQLSHPRALGFGVGHLFNS